MPWIQVIDGKSATFSTEDSWNISKKITILDAYKDLYSECEAQGLVLYVVAYTEEGRLTFYIGKELYPDQYTYEGTTLIHDRVVTPEQKAATITQFDKLMVLLQEAGFVPVVEPFLTVSQFD